jgi:mannose-6-phosphate isomerase-like protein (cupin superfamily)
MPEKFRLDEKFSRFSEHWRPKVVAALNGQEIKVVKVAGTFPWHQHDDADEFFLVWKGSFRVEFRDHAVELGPGECLIVLRVSSTAPRPTRKRRSCCSSRPPRVTPAM